jgi:trigger factor
LKIETEYLEDRQAKLTVEVDEDLLEGAKRRAARKIASRAKIPGFRPGKAPYAVIVRQFGDAAILEEAIELLVDDIYPKVLEQAEINPYGPGRLENITSMEPPVLEFVVPLEAEVVLGDYQTLRKPYELPGVSDEDVEKVLANIRERNSIIEPVDRSVQEGDLVSLRLTAFSKEAGQDETIIPERSVEVVVRSEDGQSDDRSDEWPYAGFSSTLLGKSVLDEGTTNHKFSESEDVELVRGREVEFTWTVESVKSRTLPELNDEFVATLGEYSSVESLREEIRSTLEAQNRQNYNSAYDDEIIDQALELTTIKYPPQMLDREVDSYIRDLENRLDLELYMKSRSLDIEGLRNEVRPYAESRMKRSLYLLHLAKAEDIQITPDELQTETTNTMNTLSRMLPQKEARRLSDQKVLNNLVGNIMLDLMSQRAMERLRDIFSGKLEETADHTIVSEDLAQQPIREAQETAEASEEIVVENLDAPQIPQSSISADSN